MIVYRGHAVYVVSNSYPVIVEASEAVASPASDADLTFANLGVFKEGCCVPLSEVERREILNARGVK